MKTISILVKVDLLIHKTNNVLIYLQVSWRLSSELAVQELFFKKCARMSHAVAPGDASLHYHERKLFYSDEHRPAAVKKTHQRNKMWIHPLLKIVPKK